MADSFPGVAGFLSALDHGQRERFLLACQSRESPLQVWFYACAMGYEADFTELESWLHARYPQLNRRRMLEAEAVQIESDINSLRQSQGCEGAKSAEITRSIASLTKELRGHLAEIERMSKGLDRRGLILSGVDRLMRTLQDMFSEDDDMQTALQEGFDVVWSQLSEER